MTGIVVANFGLDTLMVREVSRDHSLGNKYLTAVLGFKLISALTVMAGLYVLFKLFVLDPAMITLMAVFSIVICLNALSQSFWYYGDAFHRFRLHAGLWAFSNLIKLPLVWFLISFTESLTMIIYALVVAEFIALVISGLWTHHYFGQFLNSLSVRFMLQLFKKAWPFASIFILSAVYFRIDMIMLGIMKGDKAVGIYSAAYKLIEFLSIIPGTICVAALPELSTDYSTDMKDFKDKSLRTVLLLGSGGLGAGILLFLFSKQIIHLLYGPLFYDSIACLRILSGVVFFLFVNGYLIYVAIAMNDDRLVAFILFLATSFNILLNYYLIPRYGYMGAAVATLLSEILMLLFCAVWIRKTNFILKDHLPTKRVLN